GSFGSGNASEALDTTGAGGVSITAKTITVNQAVNTTGSGGVVLAASANGGGDPTPAAAAPPTPPRAADPSAHLACPHHATLPTPPAAGPVPATATGGNLTIATGSDIKAGGAVALTGSTGIRTGGNIPPSADAVTFHSATALSGPESIPTAGGNVLFASTL